MLNKKATLTQEKVTTYNIGSGNNPISHNSGIVKNIFLTNTNENVLLNLEDSNKIVLLDAFDNEKLLHLVVVTCGIVTLMSYLIFPQKELLHEVLNYIMLCLFLPVYSWSTFWILQHNMQSNKLKKHNIIPTNYIDLQSEQIIIHRKKEDDKNYDFCDLRKIIIQKNIIAGYTVLIFQQKIIYSYRFCVLDFDEAYAIKEVFDNYLLQNKS